MRLRALISCLCLLTAACATSRAESEGQPSTTAASAATAASDAEPELTVLPFAWPVGASAVVTEKVLKKGNKAKLRYRIDVGAREGGGVTVQIKDLKFLELAGFDLNDPEMSAVIQALERQSMAAMPAFLVDASGEFEDITDFDGLLELTLQQTPADQRESMRKSMKAPAMQALIRMGISKIWLRWAGIWVGKGLAEGYAIDLDTQIEAEGKTHTIPTRFEHKGATPGVPGHVDLAFTSKVEGETGKAVMRETLNGVIATLAAQDPSDARGMDETFREMTFSMVTTIQATVDAATLLPLRSDSSEATTMVIEGQRVESLERHSYEFAWTR